VVGRCVLPENPTLGRGTPLSPFYLGTGAGPIPREAIYGEGFVKPPVLEF